MAEHTGPEGDIPGEDDPRFIGPDGKRLPEELIQQYRKSVVANKNRHNMIGNRYGQMLHPQIMEQYHQQVMFEYLLPTGSVERLEFEIEWQKHVAKALDLLESQIEEENKPKLVTPPSGLLLPDGTAVLPDLRPQPDEGAEPILPEV